jgi:Toprim-like/Protein of unknown function (DUF3991)
MYDHELDSFKRDIHLVQFAVERYGYVRDRRESSRACHVLRHEASDDKLVVRRDADGHWTYFSVRDGRDNGTVIDFVQARGGRGLREVREELRRYLGRPRPPFDRPQAPLPTAAREPRAVGVEEAFAQALRADNSPYLNARGIRPETLRDSRFAEIWRLGPRQNVLFVHRDDTGVVTGFEVKNHGFTGFATGGRKTAWQSAARPDDRALVITESAIDALSHHQLHPDQRSGTRYLSTAGQPSASQMELLDRVFARLPRACTVVAGVDADVAGHALASRLEALVRRHDQLAFRREAPVGGKDWNDILQRVERDFIRLLPGRERGRAGPER